jgi:hypothetical protein
LVDTVPTSFAQTSQTARGHVFHHQGAQLVPMMNQQGQQYTGIGRVIFSPDIS